MQEVPDWAVRISAPRQRVCFWGAPAHPAPPGTLSQRLASTGANTGNMMIGHGLFQALDAAEKAYHPGFGVIPPERLHEHFDMVFVPASNFVSPSVDLTDQARYFARTQLPIVCFGLGSQILPGQDRTLKPGTDQFLRLVSERSGSIGVRGSFTAEVLWDLGIRNTSVVGCPSIFALGVEAARRLGSAKPTLDRVLLGFSNNVRRHAIAPEAMRASENALFQRMLGENAFYVLQNETDELALLDAMAANDRARLGNTVDRIANAFDVAPARADVLHFLTTRLRVFFSVGDWVGCAQTMSVAAGSRFHGNIAALLAGTPALFLVHDMRTAELCEVLRTPSMVLDRPYGAEEIVERMLSLDYAPFLAQLPRLMMEWRLFLARNGLDVQSRPMRAPANTTIPTAMTA